MVDAVGTTTYAYTAGGQLWTEDGPFSNDTVTNIYVNRLRTALSLQQPTGLWTNGFGYDAAKRLTSVTSPAGTFTYQLPGTRPSTLVTRLDLPNSSYITTTYDNVARLTGTHLKNSSHTTLNSHQYSYNVGHQRTQQVRTDSSTVDYTYDPIGQLKVADSSVSGEDRGYLYDAAWNLAARTNNGVTGIFSVDGLNQLTGVADLMVGLEPFLLDYDANGNLVSSVDYVFELKEYTYDDENRLVQWYYYNLDADMPEWLVQFAYDGFGRLRQRVHYVWEEGEEWVLAATVTYIYDGMRVIQERANGTPFVSYTRGTDLSGTLEGAGGIGGMLARTHGYSGGNWSTHNFYHADGNGNITYLVNSSQTLAASYRYDPYGNLISSSGSLAAANTYRFSSKEFHGTTGLYYYGYRFYHPGMQRWPNRDPFGELGGINLYQHCRNATPNCIDPLGLRAGANVIDHTQVITLPNGEVITYHPQHGNSWAAGGNSPGPFPSLPPGVSQCGSTNNSPIVLGPVMPTNPPPSNPDTNVPPTLPPISGNTNPPTQGFQLLSKPQN